MFYLILGIEALAKFGTILDFQENTIQINHTTIAMRPYKSLAQKSNLSGKAFQITPNMYVPNSPSTFARDHLEPIGTREATKRTIEIVDVDYTKENRQEIEKDTCKHLSSQ